MTTEISELNKAKFMDILHNVELEWMKSDNSDNAYNEGFQTALDKIKDKFMSMSEIEEFSKNIEYCLEHDKEKDDETNFIAHENLEIAVRSVLRYDDAAKKQITNIIKDVLKEIYTTSNIERMP